MEFIKGLEARARSADAVGTANSRGDANTGANSSTHALIAIVFGVQDL